MKSHITNPAYFRLDMLLSLGVSQVHEFARRATATLTTYRLILGRCLLAMRESKGFKKFGCSSEIHYATAKLGMNKRAARECRRVARNLLTLPKLTRAAENGLIEWSKLREIVGKAVVETEDYWLKLAKELDCDQIQKLASQTPKGGVPGDVFEEPEQPTSELRCKLSEEVLAMLDHARRLHSAEQGEAVTTAQVLEFALVSYISNLPLDQDSLEKVRQEMDKDLQAERAREIPLVAAAREMAVEIGLLVDPSNDEMTLPGQNPPAEDCAEVLAQALGIEPSPEVVQETEEALAKSTRADDFDATNLELSRVVGPVLVEALQRHQPPAISNKRICFNPQNRHTTKAQKRELLRRDGWACSTPGCCHKLYLHLHHLVPHSKNGPTIDLNLIGLCSSCHRNVHDGSLRIFLQPDGKLHFTDAEGNSVAEQADLELGQWLDFNIGWDGEEEDSFTIRAHRGEWSVFGKAQFSIS